VSGKVGVSQSVSLYAQVGNTDSTGYVCGTNPDHLHYSVQTPCSGTFCTSVSSSFLDPDVLRQHPDGIPRTNDSVISANHAPGTDIAVWRPSNGTWYLRNIGNVQYGTNGDIPVPADYSGDGIADLAVWRPSDHHWHIRNIGNFEYGTDGDIMVPADYDGQ
jgi:hypothetical protein